MIHLDVDKIANDFVESVDETLEKQRVTQCVVKPRPLGGGI